MEYVEGTNAGALFLHGLACSHFENSLHLGRGHRKEAQKTTNLTIMKSPRRLGLLPLVFVVLLASCNEKPSAPEAAMETTPASFNLEATKGQIQEQTQAFYGNEVYLIDEGTYYLRYGEENTLDEGKYINIWKNEGSTWKLHSNIWNTSLPLG